MTRPQAPTDMEDGSPMPVYRLTFAVTVDSQGYDPADAINRAKASLGLDALYRTHTVELHGLTPAGHVDATAVRIQPLAWRRLDQEVDA